MLKDVFVFFSDKRLRFFFGMKMRRSARRISTFYPRLPIK